MSSRDFKSGAGASSGRRKPVILVTGCSSGIGLALVLKLERIKAYRVVVTARERSMLKLEEAGLKEDEHLHLRPLEVTDPEQRTDLIREIDERWGGVDILINNAGISYRSVVEHMDDASEKEQMRTNYLAPMALIRLVLPGMRNKGRGKIINVSSVSGMLAMPTMSSYSASKWALEGANEALWYEMKPMGINVSMIQPGFIHSDSFTHVYYSDKAHKAESNGGVYSDYYRNMSPFISKMMKRAWATPDDVADTILKTIRRRNPPLRIPATIDARVFYYVRRLLPRRLLHPLLLHCLPGARQWGATHSRARPASWFEILRRRRKRT